MSNTAKDRLFNGRSLSNIEVSDILSDDETRSLNAQNARKGTRDVSRNLGNPWQGEEVKVLRIREKQMKVELAHRAQLAQYGPLYSRKTNPKDVGCFLRCTLYDHRGLVEDEVIIPKERANTLTTFKSELGRRANPKIRDRELNVPNNFALMTLYFVASGVQKREAQFVASDDHTAYDQWFAAHTCSGEKLCILFISVHLLSELAVEAIQSLARPHQVDDLPIQDLAPRSTHHGEVSSDTSEEVPEHNRQREISNIATTTSKQVKPPTASAPGLGKVRRKKDTTPARFGGPSDEDDEKVLQEDNDIGKERDLRPAPLPATPIRPQRGNILKSHKVRQPQANQERKGLPLPPRRRTINSLGAGLPPKDILWNYEIRKRCLEDDPSKSDIWMRDFDINDPKRRSTTKAPPFRRSQHPKKPYEQNSESSHEEGELRNEESTGKSEPPDQGHPRNLRTRRVFVSSSSSKEWSSTSESASSSGRHHKDAQRSTLVDDDKPAGALQDMQSKSASKSKAPEKSLEGSSANKSSPPQNRDRAVQTISSSDTSDEGPRSTLSPRKRKPTMTSMRKFVQQ